MSGYTRTTGAHSPMLGVMMDGVPIFGEGVVQGARSVCWQCMDECAAAEAGLLELRATLAAPQSMQDVAHACRMLPFQQPSPLDATPETRMLM